jgi:hypothetical protein
MDRWLVLKSADAPRKIREETSSGTGSHETVHRTDEVIFLPREDVLKPRSAIQDR